MLFSSLFTSGLLTLGLNVTPATEPEIHLSDSLEAVTLSAEKGITISRKEKISTRNTFALSEVLAMIPSLQINDNGGYAGLKSVSIRGLGAAHTSIYIDGIKSTNVQSGQNDLGMFNLSNSSIVVDYAQNSININTIRPTFDDNPVRANVSMYGGSFGTYLPSLRMDFRLTDKTSLSANASGIFSKGNYKYGDNLSRTNNDLRRIQAGLDLFGLMALGSYHIKAAYNDSQRGTPGSIDWPSDDRQSDKNAYLQGKATLHISDLYTLRLCAKGAYDNIFYSSTWGDSRYEQTDVQVNTVHDLRIKEWWHLSLAANINWDGLNSTSYNMHRISCLGALASTFTYDRLSADVALEYYLACDKGNAARNAFSPSANIRYAIIDGLEVTALGRRMYRIPIFNELYYVGYGNPELKPEDAWTCDLGIQFNRQISKDWKITAGLNGFYTTLTDKITSAPTEDPKVWMPINIGKVRSTGLDSRVGADFKHNNWRAGMSIGYSYLSSIDKTPDSYTYGTQVPYTTKHSVTAMGHVNWKGWEAAATWNIRCGYVGSAGSLPDWNTADITLSKEITTAKAGAFCLKITSRNIADTRYELISGYPMPGRSFIGGIEYRF